jgi:hypothetical protein
MNRLEAPMRWELRAAAARDRSLAAIERYRTGEFTEEDVACMTCHEGLGNLSLEEIEDLIKAILISLAADPRISAADRENYQAKLADWWWLWPRQPLGGHSPANRERPS